MAQCWHMRGLRLACTTNAVTIVVALSICVLSGGCTFQNRMQVNSATSGAELRGLEQLLNDHGAATLIFVHGMGGFYGDDPEPMIDGIGQRLGLRKDQVCEWALDAPAGWPTPNENAVQGLTYEPNLTRRRLVDDDRILNVYQVRWSFMTAPFKWGLRTSDSDEHRRRINDSLKQRLINDNIADVMLYLNPVMRRVIQEPVRSAMERITADDEAGPIILVSFSLGSQIMMDVLEQLLQEMNDKAASAEDAIVEVDEAVAVLGRLDSIVMLSNQLPLLDLALLDEPGNLARTLIEEASGTAANEPEQGRSVTVGTDRESPKPRLGPRLLKRLDDAVKQYDNWHLPHRFDQPDRADPITVVAVNDPNDLLAYRLMHNGDDANNALDMLKIIDVSRNVAPWAWGNVLVNPHAAHTSYGQDRRILELIVDGYVHEE